MHNQLPSNAPTTPDQYHLRSHTNFSYRIFEEDLHSVVEARTETLQTLRELGPPDLVHLVKQQIKGTKQVRICVFFLSINSTD